MSPVVVDDEVGALVELAGGGTEGDIPLVPAGAGTTAAPLLVGTVRGRADESVSLDRLDDDELGPPDRPEQTGAEECAEPGEAEEVLLPESLGSAGRMCAPWRMASAASPAGEGSSDGWMYWCDCGRVDDPRPFFTMAEVPRRSQSKSRHRLVPGRNDGVAEDPDSVAEPEIGAEPGLKVT